MWPLKSSRLSRDSSCAHDWLKWTPCHSKTRPTLLENLVHISCMLLIKRALISREGFFYFELTFADTLFDMIAKSNVYWSSDSYCNSICRPNDETKAAIIIYEMFTWHKFLLAPLKNWFVLWNLSSIMQWILVNDMHKR